MKIIELDIKLPYNKRGKILGELCNMVRGRIKDIHFLPPTAMGISEIRMEVEVDNTQKLIADLKSIIEDGKVNFKVLTEA